MAKWFAAIGGLIGLTSSIAYGVYSMHSVALSAGGAVCGNCALGAYIGGYLLIVGSPLSGAVLGAFCGSIGVFFDLIRR